MNSHSLECDPARRAFIGKASACVGLGAMLLVLPKSFAAQATGRSAPTRPVVSFHVDRPYVDRTGRAEPYHPPAGTRSGQAAAELTDIEFFSRHPYF